MGDGVFTGGGGGGGSSGGGSSSGSSSGGSSSSSSGSSSSGSSSSAAPVDPIIAEKVSAFQSIYMQLWGEPATKAYLEHAAHAGLNTWEFTDHERNKPAWAKTKAYQSQAGSLADELLNVLGG